MSKYTQKQIEMFKRINPQWEKGRNNRFRFDCFQIEKGHTYNICRCQCTGCGQTAGTEMSYGWVTWNFDDCYPHYHQARCETPYCCFYYKHSEMKNDIQYVKEANYERPNGQKTIHTSRKQPKTTKRGKTVWKKFL